MKNKMQRTGIQTTIPFEFETYLQNKTLENSHTDLNEIIFAKVDLIDLSKPIDRNQGLPPQDKWVHVSPLASVGKSGENAVVYSAIVGGDIPEFEFNAIYLHDKNTPNSCGMIIFQRDEIKQSGMTITKSCILQYSGAAESANVVVDAETWQVDISDLFAACSKIGHTHTLNEVGGSNKNYFVNGDFSVWQRGSIFDFSNATSGREITADRWASNLLGATITWSKTAFYKNRRMNAMSVKRTGDGVIYSLTQVIEGGLDVFYTQTATISFVCYSTVAGQMQMTLYSDRLAKDVNFSAVSGFSHGSGSLFDVAVGYNKIELTISNIGSNLTADEIMETGENLRVYPASNIGTGLIKNIGDTVNFSEMKMELGDEATPFVPPHPATNLAECQRHYSGRLRSSFIAASNSFNAASISFPVVMGENPSVSITSANGTHGTVSDIGDSNSSIGKILSIAFDRAGVYRIQTSGLAQGSHYMCNIIASTGL